MSDQHPVIAHWRVLCEKAGAAVYSGRNFLDARWPDGKKISLRVDEEVAGVPLAHGSIVELKEPLDDMKPRLFVFWGADEFGAIVQPAGEDEDGDLCATGQVVHVDRRQLEFFKPTGIVI